MKTSKQTLWIATYYDEPETNWFIFVSKKDDWGEAERAFQELHIQEYGVECAEADIISVNQVENADDITRKTYKIKLI